MTQAIKKTVFSKESGITISIGFLVLLIISIWRLASTINGYETALARNTEKLEELEVRVSQRWSYPMMREAWLGLERLNPSLKIPDVAKIKSEHSLNQ